jgi:hypothetical protein
VVDRKENKLVGKSVFELVVNLADKLDNYSAENLVFVMDSVLVGTTVVSLANSTVA